VGVALFDRGSQQSTADPCLNRCWVMDELMLRFSWMYDFINAVRAEVVAAAKKHI